MTFCGKEFSLCCMTGSIPHAAFFIARGWASLDDRENLEYLYKPYKALGGNGTGENLYQAVQKLPYNSPEGEKKKEE
jgi:hypothetical protein